MSEILLVAILTLPNTNHVVYEVFGTFANHRMCETARRQQEQQPHTVKTGYICLKADRN